MKIKFARTLAIASALSVAFAGLTAFAANVTTTTTYDYDTTTETKVTVTTNITGATANAEVAYYVCEEANNNNIVYIDQGTVKADGTCDFVFTDTKGKILSAIAKFGSNEATPSFPTFTFNEGTNRLTQATGMVTALTSDWNVALEGYEATFKGIVSGNVAEYGVRVQTKEGQTIFFPAYGCDATTGTFVVAVDGLTSGYTAVPYTSDGTTTKLWTTVADASATPSVIQ